MSGILYGVGLGPGDPELITIKAARILAEADAIAVPDSGGDQTALSIAEPHIRGKELLYCPVPMTRDRTQLHESHQQAAEMVCERLRMGQTIAMITLGDPSIYSSYMYIHELVTARGFQAEMIPGIPSFCAAAAALGLSLCEGDTPLHIIPASCDDFDQQMSLRGTKVVMKPSGQMGRIREALVQNELLDGARLVERCCLPGQKISTSVRDLTQANYLSILIAKATSP